MKITTLKSGTSPPRARRWCRDSICSEKPDAVCNRFVKYWQPQPHDEGTTNMKYAWTVSILAGLLIVRPAMAGELSAGTKANSPRAVRVEATIAAPLSEVWRVWTTADGGEEFFAQKANIQLALGGPNEIQFDPADERS